ncbi:unnamed protein product [Lactuca virosa]|uniref:PHD-type zinc finger plants domain-containing protein n=1 Tax=Lactuca virosa TaxID=75947 RepID=A0AAU9MRE1_9ASTR|nr:unnamed protein product [Lactuca virosa]
MIANKGGGGGAVVANIRQPISSECCMCGDYGISQELFRCKICKFRSQHKYCSNQYPKAESYKACNWCLSQKHDSGNSSNSSSSCRNNSSDNRLDHAIKNKRNPNDTTIGHGGLRERRRASDIQLPSPAPIKKLQGSSAEEESPVSTGRKRVGGVVAEEKHHVGLRKSKSANHISIGGGGVGGGGIKTRQVFRNKVRRYKLLDEVSSQ